MAEATETQLPFSFVCNNLTVWKGLRRLWALEYYYTEEEDCMLSLSPLVSPPGASANPF
jgi:hypothetical protein